MTIVADDAKQFCFEKSGCLAGYQYGLIDVVNTILKGSQPL